MRYIARPVGPSISVKNPVVYLLGEKYISSLQELSSSDNSKFVVFPADIPGALKGMMGKT